MSITPGEVHLRFPTDHSNQVDASYYIDKLPFDRSSLFTFLDLGAGAGDTVDPVMTRFPSASWIGVDIESSPEVRKRTRTAGDFRTYDGVNIPADPGSVDVVYSRQVFEHVRHPDALMKSICKVLKPGGQFIGSVSQLEPFHSFSFWNYTYFGFASLASDAGLQLDEMRPGIDGPTLIARLFFRNQMDVDSKFFRRWFKEESPLNSFLNAKYQGEPHRNMNRTKIRYAGHICFRFLKPGTSE